MLGPGQLPGLPPPLEPALGPGCQKQMRVQVGLAGNTCLYLR